jgi:hypothetical protein
MERPLDSRNGTTDRLSFVRTPAALVCLTLATAGCTSENPLATSPEPSATRTECASPSRVLKSTTSGTEVEGSSEDGITLYGQVQSEGFLLCQRWSKTEPFCGLKSEPR